MAAQSQSYRGPERNEPSYHYSPSTARHPGPDTRPLAESRASSALGIDPSLGSALQRHDSAPQAREGAVTGAPEPTTRAPTAMSSNSATTIPSISSLINSTQPSPGEQNGHRTGSHSPSNQHRPTQDIPLHKIGFPPNSDARALRDLDKATLRF